MFHHPYRYQGLLEQIIKQPQAGSAPAELLCNRLPLRFAQCENIASGLCRLLAYFGNASQEEL
jgi:hypothetical protein